VVPYEPVHDPLADAVAAAQAEQDRPAVETEPVGRLLAAQPEPALEIEPDTVAYSSGDADTDETIGDLTAE
jgi:hypothetical protein